MWRPEKQKAICTGFLFTEKNPDTNDFQLFSFRDAPAILYQGYQNRPLQNNTGHATAAFTLDVYGHVTDQMKQASAQRMEQYIKQVLGQ